MELNLKNYSNLLTIQLPIQIPKNILEVHNFITVLFELLENSKKVLFKIKNCSKYLFITFPIYRLEIYRLQKL